jgi:hypothetical protein
MYGTSGPVILIAITRVSELVDRANRAERVLPNESPAGTSRLALLCGGSRSLRSSFYAKRGKHARAMLSQRGESKNILLG